MCGPRSVATLPAPTLYAGRGHRDPPAPPLPLRPATEPIRNAMRTTAATSTSLLQRSNNDRLLLNLANETSLPGPSCSTTGHDPAENGREPVMCATATHCRDDAMIYANVAEIAKRHEWDLIDRRPYPPLPDGDHEPIRVMHSGWQEYKTPGGRSFFYNPVSLISQWQPPRARNGVDRIQMEQQTPPRNKSVTSLQELQLDVSVDVRVRSMSSDRVSSPSTGSSFSPDFSPSVNQGTTPSRTPTNYDTFRENMIFSSEHGRNVKDKASEVAELTWKDSCKEKKSINLATNATVLTVLEGNLHKTEFVEGSTKLKKWQPMFGVLTSRGLSLYKDQKCSDPKSKHYKPPAEVLDLRGAAVYSVESDKVKDKRHKQILSIHLLNDPVMYMLSFADNKDMFGVWQEALKSVVRANPVEAHERTVPPPNPDDIFGTVSRTLGKSKFGVKNSIRQSVKNKMKPAPSKDRLEQVDVPNKESIIDRLLRFLRQRPTIESLYERGIYKPEPIFGSTLTAICEHDQTPVPRFVTEVIRLIETRGVNTDGIYRVNGNLSLIQKIREHVNHEDDVHVLTGTLKLFLRELGEPVIPSTLNKDFMAAMWEKNQAKRLQRFDKLLNCLPERNKSTLCTLVEHLRKVATADSQNRMNLHSLSIVFGPVLFHDTKPPKRRPGSTKKAEPEQSVPSHVVAYNFVAFGQVTEYILEEARNLHLSSQ